MSRVTACGTRAQSPRSCLFVYGLAPEVTNDVLGGMFADYGDVLGVQVRPLVCE